MEKRSSLNALSVREEVEQPTITAKFIVFNTFTELFDRCYEQIIPEAISLDGDILALADHNSLYALGRTSNKTLMLRKESDGLYGDIIINTKDSEAMNFYERVKRGDIANCSFGFEIEEIREEYKDENLYITLTKINLKEVSVVTFPAYDDTQAQARFKLTQKRQADLKRKMLKEKLNNVKSVTVTEKN